MTFVDSAEGRRQADQAVRLADLMLAFGITADEARTMRSAHWRQVALCLLQSEGGRRASDVRTPDDETRRLTIAELARRRQTEFGRRLAEIYRKALELDRGGTDAR